MQPKLIRRLLGICLAILLSLPAAAQNKPNLQGTVKNENGEPVPHATIIIGGTSLTASEAGTFTVSGFTPGKHKIKVSSVGYNTKELTVTIHESSQETIEILLAASTGELQTV